MHQTLKLKLGFATLDSSPHPFGYSVRLMSFYVLPDEYLALQDPSTGWDVRVTKIEFPQIVEAYTQWCFDLFDACTRNTEAFWVNESMSVDDVATEIANLRPKRRIDTSA